MCKGRHASPMLVKHVALAYKRGATPLLLKCARCEPPAATYYLDGACADGMLSCCAHHALIKTCVVQANALQSITKETLYLSNVKGSFSIVNVWSAGRDTVLHHPTSATNTTPRDTFTNATDDIAAKMQAGRASLQDRTCRNTVPRLTTPKHKAPLGMVPRSSRLTKWVLWMGIGMVNEVVAKTVATP